MRDRVRILVANLAGRGTHGHWVTLDTQWRHYDVDITVHSSRKAADSELGSETLKPISINKTKL